MRNAHQRESKIFCINLSHYSTPFHMTIMILGTFVFHISSNYLLEKLFRLEGFEFGWLFTAMQFFSYALISGTTLWLSGDFKNNKNSHRAPTTVYFVVASIQVASMGLSNAALSYLPYPVQQVFKSCKLVPVMIGGKFIMKRDYSWAEVVSAALLTGGLLVLASEKILKADDKSLDLNLLGIILITGGLVADGAIGNSQERVMHDHKIGEDELVFFTNLYGGVMVLIISFSIGELFVGLKFCVDHPETFGWMFLILLTAYIGMRFVLGLVKVYGSFVAMTITSCRKVVSIILSFILFPKPLTSYFLVASLLVFSGIVLHIYTKNFKEINQRLSCFPFASKEIPFDENTKISSKEEKCIQIV